MVYFTDIKKTEHYKEHHEKHMTLFEVTKVIFEERKNIRKKGENLEVETKKHYILFKIINKIAYVINAKRK